MVYGRSHPGGRLHWGGLKAFADGSLGSRTALMWQPYADTPAADTGSSSSGGVGEEGCGAAVGGGGSGPSVCGQRAAGREELRQLAAAAVKAGLQVSVHAIGDRAVDEVAAALAAALAEAVAAGVDAAEEAERAEERAAQGGLAEAAQETEEAALRRRVRQLGERLRLRVEHVQVSGRRGAREGGVHYSNAKDSNTQNQPSEHEGVILAKAILGARFVAARV